VDAQAAQREGRQLAGNYDDMQNVREISEQPIEHRMHRRVFAEMMVIVQDEDELLLDAIQHLVEKHIDGAFGMLREFAGCFLEIGKESFAKAGHLLANTEGEVTKEYRKIGIRVVQLIPDKLSFVRSQKIRDQGSFSRAGVGGDEG
jgi:hypothetical protein